MRLFVFLLFFLLQTISLSAAHANELAERQTIQKAVESAFIDGQFDQLDAMADRFRNGRERTESGLWKLTIFYFAFNPAALYSNHSPDSFKRFEAQAFAWMEARPNSPAAKIVYASSLAQRAWFLRGTDYYDRLTDRQRSDYLTYLRKLHDHLLATKEAASNDPHWYLQMVLVAKEEGWPDETFDRLLAEAAEREPYYYQTYFYAIDRNLPQRGGSPGKIDAVIAQATDRTRDLDGQSFLARAFWFASSYGTGIFDTTSLKADWYEVAQGFQDLVSQYPDQWNINAYAKFSCLAKDRTNFLIAYNQIEERAIIEAWDYPGQDIECAVWAMRPKGR